jgi:hypothetical protein
MLMDKENTFSEDQDISQDAGTYESTYVLDLSPASVAADGVNPQIGPGRPVRVFATMTEALVGVGAWMNVTLVNSADVGLGTPTIIAQSGVQAVGVWVLNYTLMFFVPSLPKHLLRYLGMNYVISGATTTEGTITAGIIWDLDDVVNGVWTGIAANTGF